MKAQPVTMKSYYACKIPGGHTYPNAAKRKITAEKIVDSLLAAAITIAFFVIGAVLITM